jgi:hypothetical protein
VTLEALSGGDHRWFKRSTRKKRPVTRDDVNNNNNNNKYDWSASPFDAQIELNIFSETSPI